jgi:tripartite-type tricarboxylate transporter receptor subunit TctC
MKKHSLPFTLLAGLLALSLNSSTAFSQSAFPNKAITLIVPTAPGGPIDMTARIVAKDLSTELGQPIVVMNRPGGSQKIGVESLLSSPKDGYTFAAVSPASMTINPVIEKSVGYDPLKDFTYLANAIEYQSVLVVHPSIAVKNLAEFIAYAKANPTKLSYGSGGNGSSMQFTTSTFLNLTNIEALQITYKSSGPAMLGLLGGEVNMLMPDLGDIRQYVTNGSVIALAVTGSERNKRLPNVPTFPETGIPELKNWTYTGWIGFVASAGIPVEAAQRLQNALQVTLKTDKMKEAFDGIGFKVIATVPSEFKKQIAEGLESNKKVVKAMGLKPAS